MNSPGAKLSKDVMKPMLASPGHSSWVRNLKATLRKNDRLDWLKHPEQAKKGVVRTMKFEMMNNDNNS